MHIKKLIYKCRGLFLWLKWAVSCGNGLGYLLRWWALVFLSKGVETGQTATQFGPACAQTMSRLPGARLRQAERGAYPLFLPQKEFFSSFYRGLNFLQFLSQDCLFSNFCRKRNFSLVSAVGLTFLQFLPQDWLFCHVAKLFTVR